MVILGIETSCDETAAAILKKDPSLRSGRVRVLSNVIASSAEIQAKYGGVIPEQAAREQIKSIIPVIEEALIQSNLYPPSSKHHLPASIIHPPAIDAIAVTYGPGLIGSLLVGVETAKTLSLIWNKPLIPVNHLLGHFYANWIEGTPKFPCIGLLVSGGHTDLVLFTDHGKYKYLGGTRDDAAGECFDKCARLLGLPYPGGPEISKLARDGDPKSFDLPRPMINSKNFDFSFSGLKTAVAHVIASKAKQSLPDLSASIEAAIIDVLIDKTIKAAQKYKVVQIMISGGVAANKKLVSRLQIIVDSLKIKLHAPHPQLCTDNGAMIASAGFFTRPAKDILRIEANPNLALSY